ncbi:MAG: acyl-CoA thioesterase, partial [Phycisphaerales bacterium]|nr:acyl-CoA thioesterase [Phycisphaerales bacterium]
MQVRVRYCECDPMGVAHHASYLPWLEMARTELVRDQGVSYASMEREGTFLVVADLSVRYRRPARYDDVLEIVTEVSRLTRARVEHTYEVRLAERDGVVADRVLLATATTTLACVDPTGKPRLMPDVLFT